MWTGDKDVSGGGRLVRRVLAATACLHDGHRLSSGTDRLQEHGTEALLHRALLLRPLAGHVQQLREPGHLWLPQRLFQGTLSYMLSYICPLPVLAQARQTERSRLTRTHVHNDRKNALNFEIIC